MRWGFRLAGTVGIACVLMSTPSMPADAAVVHSSNSAGYSATTSIRITSFSGTLSVPKITCPAKGSHGMTASVQLSGSPSYTAIFEWMAQCNNGSIIFLSAQALLCPTKLGLCEPEAQVNAAADDSLTFSLRENAKKTTTTVMVDNTTEKQSASGSLHALLAEHYISADTSFCCGASPTSPVTPIPSFSPVRFGDLKFNGAALSKFRVTRYDMYDKKTLQVVTSAITTTASFATTFKHA